MQHTDTAVGFEWGSAVVERVCDSDSNGWVTICVRSPKGCVYVTVRKSGKLVIREELEGDHT